MPAVELQPAIQLSRYPQVGDRGLFRFELRSQQIYKFLPLCYASIFNHLGSNGGSSRVSLRPHLYVFHFSLGNLVIRVCEVGLGRKF